MAANSRVPWSNALSDFEHPCQALADFMTSRSTSEPPRVSTSPTSATGNNVCHSLMLTGAQLGANVTIATPRGYSPDIEIVTLARGNRRVQRLRSPLDTGSTASVEAAGRRLHRRLRHGNGARVTKRAPIFRPFQVNDALMQKAQSHAVFMHCLAARRNAEVTDTVLDGPQSIVFDQAENRLHRAESPAPAPARRPRQHSSFQ